MSQNTINNSHTVTIGGACAFWGDTLTSTAQLINSNQINYLVYDYLAEVTLSIMAGQKLMDSKKGYAIDFIRDTILPHAESLESKKIKVVANAGGVNPIECGRQLQEQLEMKKSALKVAVVSGDNLIHLFQDFKKGNIETTEHSQDFPINCFTLNAYTGYTGIQKALDLGADIVVTGRVADSALTLGILMHEFKWAGNDYDRMAQASLAGHLIECGAQATGGNFTDWNTVENFENIGFPIVSFENTGDFHLTKPENTGGIISKMAVAEQLVYEIADPQNYLLPDLICDWSNVKLTKNNQGIKVTNSKGKPPSEHYKVAGTFPDGFKTSTAFLIYGIDAAAKAKIVAQKIEEKVSAQFKLKNMPAFIQYVWDIIGTGATSGSNVKDQQQIQKQVHQQHSTSTEVVLKISATHSQKAGLVYFSKELAQASTSLAPGLCQLTGGRPKVHPMIKLITFLTHRDAIKEQVIFEGETYDTSYLEPTYNSKNNADLEFNAPSSHELDDLDQKKKQTDFSPGDQVQLVDLCHGRSGDKGDHGNIGIIARKPEYWKMIQQILTVDFVSEVFKDHLDKPNSQVVRFELPGIHAFNFVLYNALGDGGFASLRLDAQGKGFAQLLLAQPIEIPLMQPDEYINTEQTKSTATKTLASI